MKICDRQTCRNLMTARRCELPKCLCFILSAGAEVDNNECRKSKAPNNTHLGGLTDLAESMAEQEGIVGAPHGPRGSDDRSFSHLDFN